MGLLKTKNKAKEPKKNKKEKQPLEPQYYMSPTQIPTLNYKVYYMSVVEKVIYFALAFLVGYMVGYLFYGGIGKDEYGNPTMVTRVLDILIPLAVGCLAGKLFLPMRTEQIINKRRRDLSRQFRDFLDGITTSIGAGNNVVMAMSLVYKDLKVQYPEDAYILKEMEVLLSGMHSNFDLEDMLDDLGRRSGNADIISFANVFRVCYRKGGNIQQVLRNTHEIMSQKMEIAEDIETIVSGSKLDQMVLLIMPVMLIGIIKVMSPEFSANFVTGTGLISTTIAIGMFVASYFIGKALMDIKI